MPADFQLERDARCTDPFRQDTVDLLRAEVAQLERELADRDARLAELTSFAAAEPSHDPHAEPQPDTLALVSRLEQLLDELDRKDQHAASLEEMLRVAEEASRAEQDERAQIEAWLGEIEQRLGQREAEWQAANETLRQRLNEVIAERDRAERALSQADSEQHGGDPSQETLISLRQQITQLQQTLSVHERDKATLEQKLAAAQADTTAAPNKEERDKRLREERLQLARERAELARVRAEIEHERHAAKRVPDEMEQRVQALRDHLREIHERQLDEQKERQKNSLSGRIARLWKRLEG
jgi:chromosome segregation ATPase